MRRKGEDGVAPARAVTLMTRIVSAALRGRENEAAIDAQVLAQPIILGSQTLPDASATLKATPGAPPHLAFDLGLPGQSRLRADGDLDTGAEAKFRGDVAFVSADFALLREWAGLGAPPAVAKIAAFADALPYRSTSLSGAVEASPTGFSGRNLKLTLDRSTLTGALAFKGPDGGQPGRLDVDLASDSLDVDGLPSLAAGNLIGDLDLSLSLRAGSLHIARVGEAQIDSGSLALNVAKSGPNVTLKRLSVAGLDGASFDVEGAIGPDSTAATGHLRADRLHDFAMLVSRVAPSDWSRMLVARAAELSPAALTFGAHGGASDVGGVPAVDSLRANGSAGETQFSVTLDPRPNDTGRALTVTLDSPNSGALLRQLGVHTPTSGGGRAHIVLNANGGWDKGYDVDATSQLAGADLAWRGRFLPTAESADAKLFGSAKAKSPNLAPLAVALGLAPANGGVLGPADIGFDATLRGDRWGFSRLAATIAGVKASGDLTYQPAKPLEVAPEASGEVARAEEAVSGAPPGKSPAPAPAEIEGQLSVERMPLSGVLALALGPPQPGRTGARWSDVKFAPVPLRPPSAAVKLRVGTLDLADALTAREFATTLRFDKGRLDLDDFALRIAGGGASGHATLRRDADNVTLTGALNLDSVALDRTGFSGRIGAALDFASTGRSPAALINGLAGSGTVTFAGAALARSDPTALDRVVAKAQTPDAPLDETNIAFAFGNELNRAPLAIADGSAPLSLSAGVAKIGPIKIPQSTRGRGAERGFRSAHANDTGALYAHLLGERFEVLVGAAAERGGYGRQCVGGAEAADRHQLPFRRACRAGDRARDRSHLHPGSRHPRARLLQPASQGRAVDGSKAARNPGLGSRTSAAERASRTLALSSGSGESGRSRGGEEGGGSRRGSESRAGKGRSGQFRRGEGRRRRATHKGAVRARPRAEERPSRRQRASAPRLRHRRPGPRRARRRATRSQASSTDRPEPPSLDGTGRGLAPSASSTNTRIADDRLAPSREASTIAARRLRDRPRSSAMARSRRQNASSRETLVRCPAMTSERLMTRAFALSVAIGLYEAAGVEVGRCQRALALDEAFLRLRLTKYGALLSRFRLAPLAFLQLSRSTQIDDLSQKMRPVYFLRKASIDTTFVSPAGSAGFS